MHVKVIVGAVVMAVTEFVPHGIPVQHVHQMGVLERHQRLAVTFTPCAAIRCSTFIGVPPAGPCDDREG